MHPEDLNTIRCFLLDLDGTIALGEHLLPGARELFDLLGERGIDYLILTNNSSKDRAQYALKLQRLGLDIPEERIFTSGEATALTLQARQPGARVYVVGTPPLEQEFIRHGFVLVEDDPEVVVLGFDTTLTYAKLWRLCDLVRAGKPYIATHPDINCPTETGYMPDIGATLAFVEASTGRRPDLIVGKPYEPMVRAITQRTGWTAEQLCMVGDRLYTDMAMGAAGIRTVLVLSGETRPQDLAGASHQPDLVMQNLAELVAALKAAGKQG